MVVKQVVGVCKIKDGPTYTVKTRHLVLEYHDKHGKKHELKKTAPEAHGHGHGHH